MLHGLRKVRKTGQDSWIACCPAHDDKGPSMTLRQVDEKILIHCFAGCSASEIVGAMGLKMTDLFPPRPTTDHAGKPVRNPWAGMDVLRCVAQEAMIVAIVAQAIHDGKSIGKEDLARVHLANKRLNHAVETARGK